MHRPHTITISADKNDKRIDDLIETMGTSLTWITMCIVLDKVVDRKGNPFTRKRLENFYHYVIDEKHKWNLKTDGTDKLIDIAKNEKPYIFQACQQIPFSQLLYLAEIKTGRKKTCKSTWLKAYLQAGFCICMVWVDIVLKEHYEINKENRIDMMTWVVDYVDSYQKGYLSNDICNQLFIEELHYDMKTGEEIA